MRRMAQSANKKRKQLAFKENPIFTLENLWEPSLDSYGKANNHRLQDGLTF
jgi:hypothetical protein